MTLPFTSGLGRIYTIYTGGFLGFIILVAILEKMGVPNKILGYMFMGLGIGGVGVGMFHLLTHAFFKALLFLGAGSVSHSGSHHSFDMKKDMGGLRKKMPITFIAWIVSTLALTGVFPFAGFWSKDEIIDNVGSNGYTFLMWVGLGGAVLTAMYMTRATYLTFFGEPRGASAGEFHGDEHGEEHEMEHISVGAPEPRSLSSAAMIPMIRSRLPRISR